MIRLPCRWYPRDEILKSYLSWRLINLEESEGEPIDMVIALKFPAFAVPHSAKITWLVQQLRQAYDLFGTEYSYFGNSAQDREACSLVRRMDSTTIGESKAVFAISQNVASRLRKYNDIPSRVLYPPPALDGQFKNEEYGDYILSVSRLNVLKRVDHLIRAMGHAKTGVRCLIVGRGSELVPLQRLARQIGVADRIEFMGFVDDQALLDLYARSLAVYYAPLDEDYGLATIEAMKSGKAVLTSDDSGGVLEFVQDGTSGYVTQNSDPIALAERIDELYMNRRLAQTLGENANEIVMDITWAKTLDTLLAAG
jgi:glycosyltransferase involved in cell wall biosynthesis